ncbi:MAG: type I phosphomannose isomerase catalytic subunit [Oligoflexales bacterium]
MTTEPSATTPVLLAPDNFTPLTRTPWAGKVITQNLKKQILPPTTQKKVGESWEFSCDPAFPSKIHQQNTSIDSQIRQNPEDFLSPALKSHKTSQILIKLLNAAEPLSLQVHPRDDDPCLLGHECGKPESWLILECEPGAGLYVGFQQAWSKEDIRKAISAGKAKELFQFIPVKPMDYFEIMPGVPHAIGAGITLLEPQRVLPGKTGKTCRFWDWDRTYDSTGHVCPKGSPRELHLEDSLRIVTPELHTGKDFLNSIIKQPKKTHYGNNKVLSWPRNDHYQVHRIEVTTQIQYNLDNGYGIVTATDGALTINNAQNQSCTLPKGQTAMLPWASFPLCFSGKAEAVIVTPSLSNSQWQ